MVAYRFHEEASHPRDNAVVGAFCLYTEESLALGLVAGTIAEAVAINKAEGEGEQGPRDNAAAPGVTS